MEEKQKQNPVTVGGDIPPTPPTNRSNPMETEKAPVTFRIDRELWEEFKNYCMEEETSASRELRLFIKRTCRKASIEAEKERLERVLP